MNDALAQAAPGRAALRTLDEPPCNIAGYGYVNEPTTSAVAIENGIGFGIGASGGRKNEH